MSTAAAHPAPASRQSESAAPGGPGAVSTSQRSGRVQSTTISRALAMRPNSGKLSPRRAPSALRTWVRSRSAASSMMSAGSDAQVRPAGVPGAAAVSGTDTRVLGVEHVRAEYLDLGRLFVNGRAGEESRTQPLAAVAEQRQPYPAFELDRGRSGGQVAEALIACFGRDELAAVAQSLCAVAWAHADQLQPLGARERCASGERPTDEVALFLEQARKAEIVRRGIAVELR